MVLAGASKHFPCIVKEKENTQTRVSYMIHVTMFDLSISMDDLQNKKPFFFCFFFSLFFVVVFFCVCVFLVSNVVPKKDGTRII